MSRTYRKKSRQYVGDKERWDGTTHDGAWTRPAGGCENHGGCPYCESNRFHSTRKRKGLSIEEQLEEGYLWWEEFNE